MRQILGFCILFLLLGATTLRAQSSVLDAPLTLQLSQASLQDVLDRIAEALPVTFAYDSRHFPKDPIDLDCAQKPLRAVLDDVLLPRGLEWELKGDIVAVRLATKEDSPDHFVISGYVQDAQTGERLVGAQVYDLRSRLGTITNDAGFFSLKLAADSVKLVVSMIGYAVYGERLYLSRDLRRQVRLVSDLSLETVVITDQDAQDPMAEAGISVIQVPVSELNRLPALMGDADVLNVLKMFPGVHSSEGAQGFYVRGGGPDQNLVLLDGATVYNSSHLFGFYSIFNSEAIKDVRLVKGGFPARYGGRLSSVVDLQVREGNLQEWEGSVNLGLTSAKLSLSGPIVKDKTSIMVSGRRTILEPYFAAINHYSLPLNGNRLGYSFIDLQGKLQQVLGPKDRLSVGGYVGGDLFSSGYDIDTSGVNNEFSFGLRWGNAVGSMQWRHEWGKQVFSQMSLLYSQYRYSASSSSLLQITGQDDEYSALTTTSSVRDIGWRWAFDWMPDTRHWLRFGASSTRHAFRPERYTQQVSTTGTDTFTTDLAQTTIVSLESMVWLEDQMKLGKLLNVNVGLNFSNYLVDQSVYWALQPRASARLNLPHGMGIQASGTDMVQYIHLLTNAGVGLPTDLWVPATGEVPPQHSQQLSMGLDKRFDAGKWVLSVEGYYKRMTNLIDYQTGVNFIGNSDWQDLVEKEGKGWSRGVEVLLRRNVGRLTGWMGYTLSKTQRQFSGINFGQIYNYKYDRRHDFSTALIYKVNDHIEVSAAWLYATGIHITFPEGVYYAPSSTQLGFWDLNQGQDLDVIIDYGARNNFQLPDYHRLDLNMRIYKKVKWGETYWNFGIFNVYNRRNTYFLFLRADYANDPDSPEIKVRKMSLLPILPEVNFGFKF